ncbi:MAG: hypothetical protein LIP09_08310 [Bacteroidales bacterium]|nr:hypothetical protein [Bacteroidales bacterium]
MKTICPAADGTLLRRIVTTSIRSSAGGGSSLSDPSLETQVSGVTRDTTTYFSPFIYKNGALDRTLVTGGYVKANVPYYYLRDHQGNIRQVVNGNTGAVAQESHYYPYGGLFGESSATALSSYNGCSASPYKFGGKEQVDLLDCSYLDFSARMYDYQLGRFWTTDPLCWEKTFWSSYIFCRANPINYIDPTGLDEFDIDKNGNLKLTKKSKDTAFYILDDNGKRINSLGIPGNVVEYSSQNIKGTSFDLYKIKGEENAEKIFEFVTENNKVEWSLMKTGEKGKNGKNFLTTSHNESSEAGIPTLFFYQLRFGYHLREFWHSHPYNTPIPSGFEIGDSGDINFVRQMVAFGYDNVICKIYLPGLRKYINYNVNSTPDQFE